MTPGALACSNGRIKNIDYDINYYLATAYIKLGEVGKAMDVYNAIIALKPEEKDAYYLRGVIYTQQGNLNSAKENFDKVTALDSSNYDRIIDIYSILASEGYKETGQEYLQKAMDAGTKGMTNYEKGRIMKHAVTPLDPGTPDVSMTSEGNSIDKNLTREIGKVDGVKRVYGRSFAYDVPVQTQRGDKKACLVSYDSCQFAWAGKSLLSQAGTKKRDILSEVMEGEGILAVYHGEDSLTVGERVAVDFGEGERQLMVSGILSKCPFRVSDGEEILICSEDTFQGLTGEDAYTIIDVQLTKRAGDDVVRKIRTIGANTLGEKRMSFSDRRLSNGEVKGSGW